MAYTIYWISADFQNSLNMGTFATREEAESAIPNAWEELKENASEETVSNIMDGKMTIDAEEAA